MPAEYSKEWLIEQVKEIMKTHQALILKPSDDIVISKGYLFIILDGWHPLKSLEVPEIECSDEEDEAAKEVKKEAKKEKEIPPLTEYSCPACTMINPKNAASCAICESPRPPLA